jgi:monothiol glutaredoxin
MDPTAKATIEQHIKSHNIALFTKGTKDAPQCGFSNQIIQIFKTMKVEFETMDVLADEGVRQGIKEFSNWPTIPQVYLAGEFIGGCDIVTEMFQKGELQTAVAEAGTPHGTN